MQEKFRFGIEIEINAFGGRDFISNPLGSGESPEGISHVASLISGLGLPAEIREWGHNHDNRVWICKPDSSCGMEICSPVLEGDDLHLVSVVMDALRKDDNVQMDQRCSIHVHIDVPGAPSDAQSVASVLAWWVKCEHIFMDSVPPHRKNNRYCRCAGETSLFDDSELVAPFCLVERMSDKYLSANSFHLFKSKRRSLEFRLLEGTKDSALVENWILILMRFVSRSLDVGLPDDFKWLEIREFFDFMDFGSCENPDLINWFFSRIFSNLHGSDSGIFSDQARHHALDEYLEVFGQTHSFIEQLRDKYNTEREKACQSLIKR